MINPSDIKILIAEDEPDLRDLLAAKFRVFGFNVDVAHSGAAAWEKLESNDDFQIVVTDVRMPDSSGYDLLSKAKNRNVLFPKVFVISAFSDIPKHQLFDAGAEGFMPKPFDTMILLDVIRKSLLSTDDRWRAPSSTPPKENLVLEFPEASEAMDLQEFGVGRGGFYIKGTLDSALIDQLVSFDFKLGSRELKGTGIIRWANPDPNESANPVTIEYYGVEIVQMVGESAEFFNSLLGDEPPKAYITCPDHLKNKG